MSKSIKDQWKLDPIGSPVESPSYQSRETSIGNNLSKNNSATTKNKQTVVKSVPVEDDIGSLLERTQKIRASFTGKEAVPRTSRGEQQVLQSVTVDDDGIVVELFAPAVVSDSDKSVGGKEVNPNSIMFLPAGVVDERAGVGVLDDTTEGVWDMRGRALVEGGGIVEESLRAPVLNANSKESVKSWQNANIRIPSPLMDRRDTELRDMELRRELSPPGTRREPINDVRKLVSFPRRLQSEPKKLDSYEDLLLFSGGGTRGRSRGGSGSRGREENGSNEILFSGSTRQRAKSADERNRPNLINKANILPDETPRRTLGRSRTNPAPSLKPPGPPATCTIEATTPASAIIAPSRSTSRTSGPIRDPSVRGPSPPLPSIMTPPSTIVRSTSRSSNTRYPARTLSSPPTSLSLITPSTLMSPSRMDFEIRRTPPPPSVTMPTISAIEDGVVDELAYSRISLSQVAANAFVLSQDLRHKLSTGSYQVGSEPTVTTQEMAREVTQEVASPIRSSTGVTERIEDRVERLLSGKAASKISVSNPGVPRPITPHLVSWNDGAKVRKESKKFDEELNREFPIIGGGGDGNVSDANSVDTAQRAVQELEKSKMRFSKAAEGFLAAARDRVVLPGGDNSVWKTPPVSAKGSKATVGSKSTVIGVGGMASGDEDRQNVNQDGGVSKKEDSRVKVSQERDRNRKSPGEKYVPLSGGLNLSPSSSNAQSSEELNNQVVEWNRSDVIQGVQKIKTTLRETFTPPDRRQEEEEEDGQVNLRGQDNLAHCGQVCVPAVKDGCTTCVSGIWKLVRVTFTNIGDGIAGLCRPGTGLMDTGVSFDFSEEGARRQSQRGDDVNGQRGGSRGRDRGEGRSGRGDRGDRRDGHGRDGDGRNRGNGGRGGNGGVVRSFEDNRGYNVDEIRPLMYSV